MNMFASLSCFDHTAVSPNFPFLAECKWQNAHAQMIRSRLHGLCSSSRWTASSTTTRGYKSAGGHKSTIDYPSVYQQHAEAPLKSARRRPTFKAVTGQRSSNTTLWRDYAECTSDLAELEKAVDPCEAS